MPVPSFPLGSPLPLDAQLLQLLRSAPAPASELARQLQVPPAEIHAAIHRLSEAGFQIALHPTLGVQLESAPDRLLADDLLSRMEPLWLRDITVFEATASTNDLAMHRGLQGAQSPLAIFAETQSAGRGRFGRKWHSAPKEGVWFSLLLRPEIPFFQWPRLTSTAALATALAIESVTGLRPGIKWPNDVLVGGKKVSGLLVETGQHPDKGPFAVLGIGINANQSVFPEEIRDRATSLKLAVGHAVDRAALVTSLLEHLGRLLPQLETGFDHILSQITERSTVLGQMLQLHSGNSPLEGIAEALDEEGLLLLRLADGSLQRCSAGEVTLSPPPAGWIGSPR